jgi:hypothetical protein
MEGQGIVLAWRHMIDACMQQGLLVRACEANASLGGGYYAVWPRDRIEHAAARAFRSWLVAERSLAALKRCRPDTMEPFPHHGQAMTQAKPYKIPESVLVVIHSPDQYVLLIERADQPGFWQSVTGSRDALDEPLSETARREVEEETGIVVADLGVDSAHDGGNRVLRAARLATFQCL